MSEPKYKPGDWVVLTYPQDEIDRYGYGGNTGMYYRIAGMDEWEDCYMLEGVYQLFTTDTYQKGEHTTWAEGWLEPVDPLVEYMLNLKEDAEA